MNYCEMEEFIDDFVKSFMAFNKSPFLNLNKLQEQTNKYIIDVLGYESDDLTVDAYLDYTIQTIKDRLKEYFKLVKIDFNLILLIDKRSDKPTFDIDYRNVWTPVRLNFPKIVYAVIEQVNHVTPGGEIFTVDYLPTTVNKRKEIDFKGDDINAEDYWAKHDEYQEYDKLIKVNKYYTLVFNNLSAAVNYIEKYPHNRNLLIFPLSLADLYSSLPYRLHHDFILEIPNDHCYNLLVDINLILRSILRSMKKCKYGGFIDPRSDLYSNHPANQLIEVKGNVDKFHSNLNQYFIRIRKMDSMDTDDEMKFISEIIQEQFSGVNWHKRFPIEISPIAASGDQKHSYYLILIGNSRTITRHNQIKFLMNKCLEIYRNKDKETDHNKHDVIEYARIAWPSIKQIGIDLLSDKDNEIAEHDELLSTWEILTLHDFYTLSVSSWYPDRKIQTIYGENTVRSNYFIPNSTAFDINALTMIPMKEDLTGTHCTIIESNFKTAGDFLYLNKYRMEEKGVDYKTALLAFKGRLNNRQIKDIFTQLNNGNYVKKPGMDEIYTNGFLSHYIEFESNQKEVNSSIPRVFVEIDGVLYWPYVIDGFPDVLIMAR